MKRNVAILLFDDVEVLDFAGPFEVFSVTDELHDYQIFNVYTVAFEKRPIRARNGLSVNPDYGINEAPVPEILIIPGGSGTRPLLQHPPTMAWITARAESAALVLSVCSGALLLAKAGLLNNLQATTHHQVINELKKLAPNTQVLEDQRFVDNGRVITSAGISAGIDMSLHVVAKLLGKDFAAKSARYMEYGI